jgi:hypothetical protein
VVCVEISLNGFIVPEHFDVYIISGLGGSFILRDSRKWQAMTLMTSTSQNDKARAGAGSCD